MILDIKNSLKHVGGLLGRFGLASLFLLGGLNKILNYEAIKIAMNEVDLSPAGLLLPLVILLEIVAGAMIAFTLPRYKIAALALAIFTLATNVFFHDFWTMTGQVRELELSLFFKNIAIAGGLLFVATKD